MLPYNSTTAALLALSISLSACGREQPNERRTSRVVVDTAGGEVGGETMATPAPAARWITDANAVALASTLNSRAIAAADAELENWHIDTVRAFAATMAREHADLQHSIDSLTQRLNLTPVSPALARRWSATFQTQIDTVLRAGTGIDLAFVRQQANSHQIMADYFSQLASATERPELRALLEAAAAKATSQAQRALALQPSIARIDSIRREASRRRGTNQ